MGVPSQQSPATSGPHEDSASTRPRPRVVVGVDGSHGSRAALAHALATAARRGAVVDVVSAQPLLPSWTGEAPAAVWDVDQLRHDAEARMRDLVAEVRRDPPVAAVPGVDDVPVTVVATAGPAAEELVGRSGDADLLVVGSRGRGAVRSALLGSVALHCATHARCPVVVVRPAALARPLRSRVVVGIDGSDRSRAALDAAVREAGRRGADVVAVAAYEPTDHWTDLYTVVPRAVEELRGEVRRGAEQMVDDVLRTSAEPGVPRPNVRIEVVRGAPADVLVEAAEEADLLVLGNRGRSTLRGLLLGSVALHCVMHARSPVMVVHPREARRDAARVPAQPVLAGG